MATTFDISEDDSDLIDEALAYAEEVAGDDDALFVHTARRRFFELSPAPERTRRAATALGFAAGDQSTHIFDDPRYQQNARLLKRKRDGNFRIIGGADVPPGRFMDCVAVGNDQQWGCTGTLIAPTVVLSAGHCADYATRVYFGTDVDEPGSQVRVLRRIRHPEYHQNGRRNDLMVLVLEEPVNEINPRRLATSELIDAATDVRLVGFGNVDRFGSFGYGRKRQVDVPVASPRCDGLVGGEEDSVAYGCDRDLEMIAGKPMLARDSCTGDSGGPALVQGEGGEWLLAAATSRATDSAVSTCGDGGVYVRVDRYRAWISDAAGVEL